MFCLIKKCVDGISYFYLKYYNQNESTEVFYDHRIVNRKYNNGTTIRNDLDLFILPYK